MQEKQTRNIVKYSPIRFSGNKRRGVQAYAAFAAAAMCWVSAPVKAQNLTGVSFIGSSPDAHIVVKSGRVIAWGDPRLSLNSLPAEMMSGVSSAATRGSVSINALKNGRLYSTEINPVPAEFQSDLTDFAVGNVHIVGLKDDGVVVWDIDSSISSLTNVPVELQSGGVTAVAAGQLHSLALKNGRVFAWGLDISSGTGGMLYVPASAQSGVTAIAASLSYNLALKNGGVIAWGNGNPFEMTIPAEFQSGVTAIAAGSGHVLGLKNGGVIARGENSVGQSTVPASARSGVTAIAAGQAHSLALKEDGSVLLWGAFSDAQIQAAPWRAAMNSLLAEVNAVIPGTAVTLAIEPAGAGMVNITWSGSGITNQLQYTTDLPDGSWTDLGDAVEDSGSVSTPASGANRYYRLVR